MTCTGIWTGRLSAKATVASHAVKFDFIAYEIVYWPTSSWSNSVLLSFCQQEKKVLVYWYALGIVIVQLIHTLCTQCRWSDSTVMNAVSVIGEGKKKSRGIPKCWASYKCLFLGIFFSYFGWFSTNEMRSKVLLSSTGLSLLFSYKNNKSKWHTRTPTHGLASTLRMHTAISPGQWQPWTALHPPRSAVKGRLRRAFSPISARRLCHAEA